jgi:hypothetical protein
MMQHYEFQRGGSLIFREAERKVREPMVALVFAERAENNQVAVEDDVDDQETAQMKVLYLLTRAKNLVC